MKILAIKQPWAALIVSGQKDVEDRVWATRYRGPLIIHASQRPDDIMADEIAPRFGVDIGRDLPLGGIIGIVELVDVVRSHPSKWYVPGLYAFVLKNPRPLPFVPWRGALTLREAPRKLLSLLNIDGSARAS
jgi:hypothetical protein